MYVLLADSVVYIFLEFFFPSLFIFLLLYFFGYVCMYGFLYAYKSMNASTMFFFFLSTCFIRTKYWNPYRICINCSYGNMFSECSSYSKNKTKNSYINFFSIRFSTWAPLICLFHWNFTSSSFFFAVHFSEHAHGSALWYLKFKKIRLWKYPLVIFCSLIFWYTI